MKIKKEFLCEYREGKAKIYPEKLIAGKIEDWTITLKAGKGGLKKNAEIIILYSNQVRERDILLQSR